MQIQWKRRLQTVGIIIGVYLGFRYVLPIMVPFLLGWFLAALVYPMARKAEKKFRINVTLAGSFFIVLAVAAAALLLWLGMREILAQIRYLLSNYETLQNWGMYFLGRCCEILEDGTGIMKEDSQAFFINSALRIQKNFVSGIGTETVGWAAACMKGMISAVSGSVIAVISGIFILRDMEELGKKCREYAMLRGCRRVFRRLKTSAAVYFKAQIFIMLTVSAECTAGFWLLKSPYYLIFGIALGFLDALPLVGTGLILYPAAVIFLIRGEPVTAVGCFALEMLTSVTRQFMEPRLLGEKLGIYPVVVLAAVYLGLILYGPAGVLLGPVSFFMMYEIGKEWDVWD